MVSSGSNVSKHSTGGRGPQGQRMSPHDVDAMLDALYRSPSLPEAVIAARVAATQERLASLVRGKRAALAYSGGKDSIALAHLAAPVGVAAGVLGIPNLPYPSFDAWLTAHKPPGITTVRTRQDWDWLRAHPEMLFPHDSALDRRWYHLLHGEVTARYCREAGIEVLLVGRRRADGNFVARAEEGVYTRAGVLVVPLLHDWSHAELLAYLHYARLPLPPSYTRPLGWVNGSQYFAQINPRRTGIAQPWTYLATHEPDLVAEAIAHLPQARAFWEEAAA